MYACLHGHGDLIAIATEFSPIVEATAPQTVAFDVAGLDRLFGLPQDVAAAIARRARETGVQAALALATNPDAAISAARGFPGVHIIPHGDEAKFLATLPVTLLDPSPELLETLERWGIRRFGEFAALPPLGIAERLGPEGLRLRRLSRGEAERKLRPIEDPLRFEDQIEMDYPIELLEPLAFLLSRLISGLATRLATRALATDELRLRLRLENATVHERTLRLPVPSLDTKAFLKLLQLDLEAHPPAAPVVHLWMGVNPVKPQAAQNGLFIPVAPEPVKLELTIARIQAIVGEGRVGAPELIDTHRPGAFRLRSVGLQAYTGERSSPDCGAACQAAWRLATATRADGQSARRLPTCPTITPSCNSCCLTIPNLALRIFRPPRTAQVALASGHPSFVAADRIRGKVLEFAGPWRTSGDWWTIDPWHRDEWNIALSDGALYRLFCSPRGWFIEGAYD